MVCSRLSLSRLTSSVKPPCQTSFRIFFCLIPFMHKVCLHFLLSCFSFNPYYLFDFGCIWCHFIFFCLCFSITKILQPCHLNNTCVHDLIAAAPSTISSLDNIDFQKLQNGRYLKIAFFSYHVLPFTSIYFIKYLRYPLLIKPSM